MKVLRLFSRRPSAPMARERLQILLAHERTLVGSRSDLVSILQEEILAVLARHLPIDREKVRVKMDRRDTISTLEVDVEIRTPAGGRLAAAS